MNDQAMPQGQYVVVARRYRPQGFDDLVGQSMVSQALSNAIETDRVGHAYLFTGARGVGKTSTARILSKALNCHSGPTVSPCHNCDICQSIASGEDVDVLEIDGASNRGIDEIRQLRSNVNVRPSRSRYKVYIIDEVHMLTKEAFNALLKTLEEPPPHVKFIFCTTDPEKIPITVLSRCQRFDFSPVGTEEIVDRLRMIVESEGAAADEEALRVLARKAAGSVRDSQSLLEQLMSFTSERITLDAVHNMLGTAGAERLHGLVAALVAHDAAAALSELDTALADGVDAGQLAEQLLGCVRDLLAISVGGGPELMLHSSESQLETLTGLANSWGTPNLLASAEILDHALSRMRLATHTRVVLETSLIRIAQLEDLQALAEVISRVQSGDVTSEPKKKTLSVDPTPRNEQSAEPERSKGRPAAAPPTPSPPTSARIDPAHEVIARPSTTTESAAKAPKAANESSIATRTHTKSEEARSPGETNPPVGSLPESKSAVDADKPKPTPVAGDSVGNGDGRSVWLETISRLEGLAADCASQFEDAANSAPNRLVITFPAGYTSSKAFCERPDKIGEIERIVSEIAGRKLKLEFHVRPGEKAAKAPIRKAASARQRQREILQHSFVMRALEVFDAEVTGVTEPKQNRG